MAKRKNVIAPDNDKFPGANVIAPSDERAIVAMDKQADAIEKATKLYGDGEPFEIERILDCIEYRENQAMRNVRLFGRYCLWLKESIGWGGFVKALESRNYDVRGAYHAMLQYEKFGDNFATVANLGSRKSRALTYFTKEEIDKYVQGGPLRDIPHDDVAMMTSTELEKEVRRHREKEKRLKEVHEKEVEKLNEIIDDLKIRTEDPAYLTEEQKTEKVIAIELEGLRKRLFIEIQQTRFHLGECLKIIDAAQKIEGVTYPTLEKWAKEEYEELAEFVPMLETLDEALQYVNPDRGDGDGSAA